MSQPPKGTRRREIASPYPYYIAAAFWLASAFIFPMYRLVHFILLSAASALIFLFAKKRFKPTVVFEKVQPTPVRSGERSADTLISEGEAQLAKLRALNEAIADPSLSAKMDRLESIGTAILVEIAKAPDKAPKIRRFTSYYLPSMVKMLETYRTLSSHEIQGENISSTLKRIEHTMDTLILAFEKQLDLLYSDEALDLSTDIDALEAIFAQEGLRDSGLGPKN